MDQKENQLELSLIEIAKSTRPAWAAYGDVELYTMNSGTWVCHAGKFRARGVTPTEAVNKLILKLKEARS